MSWWTVLGIVWVLGSSFTSALVFGMHPPEETHARQVLGDRWRLRNDVALSLAIALAWPFVLWRVWW